MKKETRLLQTGSSVCEYLAPSVKVREFRHRSVLCISQQMDSENDDADWED